MSLDKTSDVEDYSTFVSERFSEAFRTHSRVVFTGSTVSQGRAVLSEILWRTSQSLSIISGSLSDAFYDYRTFKETLKRLREPARCILTGPTPPDQFSILRYLHDAVEEGRLIVKSTSAPLQNFLAADGVYLRAEQGQLERMAIVMINGASEDTAEYKAAKQFIDAYTHTFNNNWNAAKSLEYAC